MDPVKSPVQQSSPEVIISDDELLASPRKEIKDFNENCDLISTTPKQTSSVKRKLCSEEETPDIIPATPTVKTRKRNLACKRTKRSKVGIVKLEKCFPDKGSKKGFSLFDSLDDAYNNDVMGDRVQHTSPCKKIQLNANESTCTQEDKSSDSTTVKVVRQTFNEMSADNKKTIKDYENEDCIGLNNTSDCKKLVSFVEKVESHDVNNQDMKCDNLLITEQYVNDATSIGCDMEANSLEQLIDTKDNIFVISKFDGLPDNIGSCVPETGTVILNDDTNIRVVFLEDTFLNNPVVSKNKVSDCNIPKATIKQCIDLNNDGVCTSNLLEINKSKARQCTGVVDSTLRCKETVFSDVLQLKCNYSCGSIDSNNKAFGCDFLSSQDKTAVVNKCTVSSKDIDLQELSSKSDSINLEASDCSFEKSDQCADVLCGKVQTAAAAVLTFLQAETESGAQSSDNVTQEDHPAWLSLEDWDLSLIDEKQTE
jgi:hypothetical protein